jgi:hypothetical protein
MVRPVKVRVIAVALDLAARVFAGLLLGLPLYSAVSASGIGHFEGADRLLFQPGGLYLTELTRLLFSALVPLGNTALVTALALALLLLLPHGALLAALADREQQPYSALLGRGARSFPALVALSGLTLIAQGTLLVFFSGVASAARRPFSDSAPPVADAVALALLALGGVVALALGVARDLCRAAAVVESSDGRSALRTGLLTLKRRPGRVIHGYLLPAAAGLVLFGLGAALTGWLDVSQRDSFRLPLVTSLHFAVLVGLAICRARWLATAVALVEAQPPASSSARR